MCSHNLIEHNIQIKSDLKKNTESVNTTPYNLVTCCFSQNITH